LLSPDADSAIGTINHAEKILAASPALPKISTAQVHAATVSAIARKHNIAGHKRATDPIHDPRDEELIARKGSFSLHQSHGGKPQQSGLSQPRSRPKNNADKTLSADR